MRFGCLYSKQIKRISYIYQIYIYIYNFRRTILRTSTAGCIRQISFFVYCTFSYATNISCYPVGVCMCVRARIARSLMLQVNGNWKEYRVAYVFLQPLFFFILLYSGRAIKKRRKLYERKMVFFFKIVLPSKVVLHCFGPCFCQTMTRLYTGVFGNCLFRWRNVGKKILQRFVRGI